MQLAILGRETGLCRAELAAVSQSCERLTDHISATDTERSIDSLGGVTALAAVVRRLPNPSSSRHQLSDTIIDLIVDVLPKQADKKLPFSISWYGERAPATNQLNAMGLTVKKRLREYHVGARYVAAKAPQTSLNTAQLKYNRLLEGWAFVVVMTATELVIGRISAIQDIDWYSRRDYGRPCRDAKVGMLPPKLAQILINLSKPQPHSTIIDPFCGGGVVLAEALLMGHAAWGGDLEPKMIECSRQNLAWLTAQRRLPAYQLQQADARDLQLAAIPQPRRIVSEGYLGPADRPPTEQERGDINRLYESFISRLSSQQASGERLVLAVPVWLHGTESARLAVVDRVEQLGYNYMVLDGVDTRQLIYARTNQRVGRHILPLVRK